MRVLFDTSVLVAALIISHPQHSVCFSRLKVAEFKQAQGFISTHSLAETYSVMTRLPIQPRITPEQVRSLIIDILQYLEIIPLLSDDYQAAITQMAGLNLPGGGIFDDILLTLNPKHFTRLGEAIANIVEVPK